MFDFLDTNKKNEEKKDDKTVLNNSQRITVRGPNLGDTVTIITSPSGKDIRVVKGGF